MQYFEKVLNLGKAYFNGFKICGFASSQFHNCDILCKGWFFVYLYLSCYHLQLITNNCN